MNDRNSNRQENNLYLNQIDLYPMHPSELKVKITKHDIFFDEKIKNLFFKTEK